MHSDELPPLVAQPDVKSVPQIDVPLPSRTRGIDVLESVGGSAIVPD